MMRAAVGLLLGVVGFAGCGDAGARNESAPSLTQGTPMGGIPVVVDSTPRFRIGRADGTPEEVLDRVVSPQLLSDGRLVIPVAGDLAIRVYSASGALLTTHGRRGEGPGEFESITAAWTVGDTIEVHDSRLGRITRLLGGDATQVVTLRPEGPAQRARGRLGDRWVLSGLVNAQLVRDAPELKRDTSAIRLFALDGGDLGELDRLPGTTRYRTREGRSQPEPLSPDAWMATQGGMLFVGETMEPVVRGYDSTGALKHEIRWKPDAAADPRRSLDSVLELVPGRQDRNQNLSPVDYSDAPVPERLSVFWGLIVDEAGFVWILPYDPLKHAWAMGGWRGPGPGGRWMVFTPTGERVADVEVPANLYPSQITRNEIVGIERDRYGVESVAVYGLERRFE